MADPAIAASQEPKQWAYPNALRSSLSYWWSNGQANAPQQAENAILERGLTPHGIALNRATDGESIGPDGHTAVIRQVKLPGKDQRRFLNTLEMVPREGPSTTVEEGAMPIVCMHGYGGGTGFYFQQLAAMSALSNTRLYCLDMLGMGFSGRPRFPRIRQGKHDSLKDVQARVEQAETFFVDSLEEYRKKMKFERFTLVGHSLGAYLSLSYALRYPTRVHKLILISPVGVPESPYASPIKGKEGEDAEVRAETLVRELSGDQRADVTGKGPAEKPKAPSGWWVKLWEANISPFQLVRLSSFYGPNLVSFYASRRFALFPNDVQRDLFQYLYQICRERGSGEYALAHILAPGAYARHPMIKRIAPLECPVTFCYGEHDWMDKEGGAKALEILKAKTGNDRQKKQSRLVINPHSGHWVFLDSPHTFNTIITKELREALADWPKGGAAPSDAKTH